MVYTVPPYINTDKHIKRECFTPLQLKTQTILEVTLTTHLKPFHWHPFSLSFFFFKSDQSRRHKEEWVRKKLSKNTGITSTCLHAGMAERSACLSELRSPPVYLSVVRLRQGLMGFGGGEQTPDRPTHWEGRVPLSVNEHARVDIRVSAG